MPLVAAAQAAGVPISSARRWVQGLPAGAAPAPPGDLAEVLAALRRLEREIAFTRGDLVRLQRAVWRVGGAMVLALFAALAAGGLALL